MRQLIPAVPWTRTEILLALFLTQMASVNAILWIHILCIYTGEQYKTMEDHRYPGLQAPEDMGCCIIHCRSLICILFLRSTWFLVSSIDPLRPIYIRVYTIGTRLQYGAFASSEFLAQKVQCPRSFLHSIAY